MIRFGQYLRAKYRLFGLSLFCALLIIFSQNPVSAIIFDDSKGTQENAVTSLSGFKPDVIVSYRITGSTGTLVRGKAKTDKNGNLIIPMTEGMEKHVGDTTYNFIIDEENQALNIVFKHDTESGDISVKGSGANEFTKIVIQSEKGKLETKSDWSGIFEENNIKNIWSPEEEGSYKVAFFNIDPSQKPEDFSSPAMIKVGFPGDQTSIRNNLIRPLQAATEQLVHAAMQQAFIIGTFFDAKEQLEVQNDIQALKAQAFKDYQPSDQMCRFGSFARSLGPTENKAHSEALAFNEVMTDYYTNIAGGSSSTGQISSIEAKLKQFREVYCDPSDNDGNLDFLCEHDQDGQLSDSAYRADPDTGIGGPDTRRFNKDIDFTRTFDTNYTLDINLTDGTYTEDEQDVIALAKNLYWPSNFATLEEEQISKLGNTYMAARRIKAINSVAHQSFARQLAMKSKAPDKEVPEEAGWAHMKTLLRDDFGLSEDDVNRLFGENPSYHAQMDVLSKKIYQSPDFYTNLYDKEANIDRIQASMEAISLMQLRDQYDLALRHEMLMSALLQTDMLPMIERVEANLYSR